MASSAINIKDWRREIPGSLSEDGKTFMFDKVESVNARGKKTEWRVIVRLIIDGTEEFVDIKDEYFDNGAMPEDLSGWIKVISRIESGKIRDSVPTIILAGKNAGRANARNVFCQALRDALSLHNKQLKKVVGVGTTKGTPRHPPMLAQILREQKRTVDYTGVYVQRKYNGVRTVATLEMDNSVIMYGRRKLLYPGFTYIKTELFPVLNHYWTEGRELYLDGEIYKHGMALQDISGYARREDKPDDIRVNYIVYDCFVANEPDLNFTERNNLLREIFENFTHLQFVQYADTVKVNTEKQVQELYESYLEQGYEGAMVRIDEPYRYSHNEYHSRILLKIKPTLDAEFSVIDWETGEKGKAAEAVMIVCETPEGRRFNVTPAMELPDRIELARKMGTIEENGKTYFENNYLGKKIRVYFDEYSNNKVPQRARTKMERMGIDIIQ